MKKVFTASLLAFSICTAGCSPLEKNAYNTVVAAKGFLDSVRAAHPECREVSSTNPAVVIPAARVSTQTESSTVCHLLVQATAAKDLLIDAGEEYCAGGQFESGGACNAPKKGDPKFTILTDKLRASMNVYTAIERDLKGLR